MKRLVAAASAVVVAASALAMPTKAELGKAQSLVAELMAPAMADYKSASAKDKAAAALKVADTSVEFANAAETEAAKFLLLKGAVSFYTRGEAYDKAADTVTALQSGVKNVTPEVIAEITGKATGRISESKAPRLFALYRSAKLQVRAANEAKTLAQKLKRVKSDALQRRYAEALAVSGDWKAAYVEFAKLSNDKLKAIVEAEASGKAKNVESGEFWWGYEPAMEDADDIFKAHAAAFYRKALVAGEITGLKKNIVEQRIKPYGEAVEAARGVAKSAEVKQSEKRELTFAGYLPRVKVLLLKGIALDDIREFAGTMAGSHVGKPAKAKGYVVGSGDGWKTVQFQLVDAPTLMCVQVRFEQGDGGVHGFVEKSLKVWSNGVPLGTDINSVGKKWWTAYGDDQAGYGIKDLVVTVGGKGDAEVAASGQGTGAGSRAPAATGLYCVIDLSGGPDAKKYPVSYLSDMPKGGWSDEYKTTKLVLRRVEPGKPVLVGWGGGQRRTSVSEPYYLGVFEVTQGQWEQVIGTRPSFWRGKDYRKRPVECVSYSTIRGKSKGSEWPKSNAVDEESFLGLLRAKTGVAFELPTDKQWEYACAAGTESDYNNGESCSDDMKNAAMDAVGRYKHNGGWDIQKFKAELAIWGFGSWKPEIRESDTKYGTAAVGSYLPNKFGFYALHGNVWEWCLDWENADEQKKRVVRSGWWFDIAVECCTWIRKGWDPNDGMIMHGFRLCLPLAGGAVKSAPAATTPSAGPIGLKTGGNSPFTVNGNIATLKLANGEKIEFVKCPPGEFKMLKGYEKNASTVKVKISRPFWIARKRMTRGQRGAIAPNVPKLQPSAGNENVTFEGNVRNADEEMLLRRLTDDFGKSLPAGYVFRLPSIAEYEYAYHANTKDWNDPYIYDDFANVNKGTVEKMRAKDDDSLANAWGLLAMANLNALMDRFPIAFAGGQRRYDERMKGIELAEGTTDPFFWCEEDAYPMTACWGNFNMRCLHNGRAYRLVIGPDLVSEWKAKNGKK